MDSADISDPTDWNKTSLPAFATVEASLRCQICKEFFSSAVITSCYHTFCSLCIRRCIVSDGKCPTCKTSIQEPQLRRNVAVQEVTDAFTAARPDALKLAQETKEDEAQPRKKRKRSIEDDEDVIPVPTSQSSQGGPRRSQRNRGRQPSTTTTSAPDVYIIDEEDQLDGTYDPEPQSDDGLVACPICSRRMKEELVFPHLNTCDGTAPPPSPRKPSSRTPTPHFPQPPRKASESVKPPQERLPSLNYSLLKEAALKKKLSDLNIPNTGPKALLQRRHTEWINLWNANCDSSHPRTRRELMADLDRWERTQGGKAREAGENEILRKDFDGIGWARNHKSEFDELIANARKKRESPAPAPAKTEGESEATKDGEKEKTDKQPNGVTREDEHTPIPQTTAEPTALAAIPAQPRTPKHNELVSRPVSPVPGFNLSRSIHEGTPVDDTIRHQPNPQPEHSTDMKGETAAADAPAETMFHHESRVVKKPMFELPKDPVVDTEMSGVK